MKERRHFPRYSCDFELQISSPQAGRVHPVQSHDISEAGISLMVSQSVKTRLAQEGTTLDIGNKFILLVPATDSHPGEPQKIECQVMHVRRLSQELYQVGAWLNSSSAAELSSWSDLLSNASQTE